LEILQNEPWTAAEVAYKTGFGSPTYFNKCFHDYFGYAPGKVIKGESNNGGQDSLVQGSVNIKSGKTKKKAFVFTLPGILIFAVLLSLAGFLVFKRTQKSEWPNNLYTKNGRISIAVMPFLNMTRDTTWDVWQDGIQQDLISYLSNNKELKVRQKETIKTILLAEGVPQYASISPEIASTISKKLHANIFIYGNIQKSGSKLRLNAQIILTKTKDVLQSFEINGPYKEDIIIDITDSLREKITNYLLISKLLKEYPEYQHLPVLEKSLPIARRWGKDYLKSQVYWFYGYLGYAYHKTGLYRKEKRLYNDADQ
jgi:TolB-like protein